MNRVIKRNGQEVEFETAKIRKAIEGANKDVTEEDKISKASLDEIVQEIVARCANTIHALHVEEIQDIVEEELMDGGYFNLAREYIKYRYKHQLARDRYSEMMDAVDEKLSARNVQNQNANVDEHSFGGRIGEATDLIMRQYALDYCMSEKTKFNHINNRVYQHDLNRWAVGDHNCLTIPFDDLLAKGFNTRQTDVRPAQSVSTAFQLVAVIFQLQTLQQFGGVSASHIDWTMVPYVRKSFYKHFKDGVKYLMGIGFDKYEGSFDVVKESIESDFYKSFDDKVYNYALDMTTREVHQAVEAMYHNLNTLQSRSGNQLPFTSINYGTCTLPEGRMVTKAILEISINGIGALHKTSIFPCGIFQVMEGVNKHKGDPNYDLFRLALRSTAQRLYPNYANVDWSVNAGYDINDPRTYVSTMGCRTYNGCDINGFGQLKDGRGNIAPATVILPTLAMEAKDKAKELGQEETKENVINVFMQILDEAILDTKDSLLERFEWICSQSPESAKFMYENGLMAGYKPEEGIRSALKHGTLAIGQIGLAETLQILVGCNQLSQKGMDLAKKIEQLFKDRCAEFKQEYKLNFGVYYTPKYNWEA